MFSCRRLKSAGLKLKAYNNLLKLFFLKLNCGATTLQRQPCRFCKTSSGQNLLDQQGKTFLKFLNDAATYNRLIHHRMILQH